MGMKQLEEEAREDLEEEFQKLEELEEEYNPPSEREKYLSKFDTSVEEIIEEFRYEPFFDSKDDAARYVERELYENNWEETHNGELYSAARYFAERKSQGLESPDSTISPAQPF